MYLSRIELDEKRRETVRALALPNVIHGAVENSIGGERSRDLWRVDRLFGKCYLMILSDSKPELKRISAQFGKEGDAGETKDIAPLLSRIAAGQRWRFRLRANPIHTATPKAHGERGKVHAHVTTEQQREWLAGRAERNGFSLGEGDFDVVETQWHKFAKHSGAKDTVTIRTATYEGVLTVNDVELFKAALTGGIGKAKAYGCGMITIINAE